jgi:hypothetical protein
MAVQKILYQQIANSGGTAGQVLIANSTGVTWGDANNTAYLGGTAAASYQTTAGLSANVATLTANNTSYVGTVTAANVVSNAQLSSNLANYALLSGAAFTGNVSISGNLIVTGTTVTVNAATLDVKDINITVAKGIATAAAADGAGLTVDTANIGWYYNNASNTWQSNVGITPSANVTYNLGSSTLYWSNVYSNNSYHSGTVNAAVHSVGTSFIANSSQLTIATPVSSNGGVGTSGQVLTSNGATGAPYWSTVSGGGSVNVAAQYAFTNTISFSNVVTHTANVSVNGAVIANGGAGTSGQVLTSSAGGNVYWSTVSGGGGFTNGQSISVSNLAITGVLSANGGSGTSGQYLVSAGTGNTYWSTVSPLYNYSYSSQFTGANYLTTAASSAQSFGTGDFTIEMWVYPTQAPLASPIPSTNQMLWGYRSGSDTSPQFYWNITQGLSFGGDTTNFIISNTQLTLRVWQHIAVVRIGTAMAIYLNGASIATATNSTNFSDASTRYIGGMNGVNLYPFYGFISNLRVVKGTGVYTSAFTVPTSPLTATQQSGTNIAAITGTSTSLLTCQTLNIVDASAQSFAITNVGGVTTNPQYIPFASTNVTVAATALTSVRQAFTGDGTTTSFSVAGGYTPSSISVFLNGVMLRNGTEVTVTSGSTVVFATAPPSGALIDVIGTVPTTYSSITPVSYSVGFNGSQTLTVPTSTTFGYGTGDFSIEFWAYFNSVVTNTIVSNLQTTTGIQPHLYLTAGSALAYYTNGAVPITGSVVTTGVWYHIALVRIGGSTKLYLNGTQTGSTYTDTNNYGTTNPLVVGDYYTSGSTLSGVNRLNGYISNLRVVKGVGVYTNAFTPPTSPLAAVQSTGPNVAAITGTQTALLTCNAPTIVDGSNSPLTITNTGAATVSTSVVPTFTNVTITSSAGITTGKSIAMAIVFGG